MKTTNRLVPGDYVTVKGPDKLSQIRYPGIGAIYLGPRGDDRPDGYRFQNESGLFEKGKTGFDRKSVQDWITLVHRDGTDYRYHPSDWGPLCHKNE